MRAAGIDHREHLRAFQRRLEEMGLDAALILDRPSTHWLTGFRGTASTLLVLRRSAVFITDFRYIESARSRLRGVRVALQRNPLDEQAGSLLRRHRIRRLGLEGTIAHERWTWARRIARGLSVRDVAPALREMRAMKTGAEIALIRRAVRLGDDLFTALLDWLPRRLARGALTEREIARWLRGEMEIRGAEGPSFPPIIAAGPNSALPHAVPGDRRVRRGQFLLFDFGVVLGGYCSDMTRTIVLGRATARHRRIYETVLEAQRAAAAAIRAGVRARDVDAAAREVIRRAGHAKHFGHGTGHGVGIEIHEAPRLAQPSVDTLAAGNIVTNEPGIYVPDFGGVRIEDMAVVREGGSETLTQSPKTLLEL